MKTFLAKPSGITLEEHVSHVVDEANYLLKAFPFSLEKYARLTNGKSLSKWLVAAAKYHDDGKKHEKWQTACQLDFAAFQKWQKQNDGGTFKDFESAAKSEAGKYLREAGIRHEIASLWLHREHNFALPVWVAIGAHHGKLSIRHEKRWKEDLKEDGYKIWVELRRKSVDHLVLKTSIDFQKTLECYPSVSGVRAWLVAADQRASAGESNPNEPLPPFKAFSYRFPHKTQRSVQQIVAKYWQDDFLLVRAPTGAGKTDAALLWAQKQIENNRAERLIIAMPTRFTSNALSINVAESLSETGLYHSTAWQTRFQKQLDNYEISMQRARNEHEFARRLLTPVTVCTIDHLLMALTLTREDHHQILFNLMNSCLVIDEADFYDEFTQANILVLLEALNHWKVPVMLMSASLPEVSKALYEKSGYKIAAIRQDEDESNWERPRCQVKTIRKAIDASELSDLLTECLEKGAGIIYANTVARAMDYYNWFEARNVKPILYHSRFTEPDKKAKEEQLLAALGKDGTGKGFAILTQIGEMSVNISADWMLSDICPIDRLVQRVGRLCRFDIDKIGDLHIVIPQKAKKGAKEDDNEEVDETELYPAPYGTFTPPYTWIPHTALVETIEKVKVDTAYSARDFVELINQIYRDEVKFGVAASKNSTTLKEFFVENWLVGGRVSTKEDDENAANWKSRDIAPQEAVFIDRPKSPYFSSWLSFQTLKNENTVIVPNYIVDAGKKKYYLRPMDVFIGDDKKATLTITFVEDFDVYSFEKGFNIPSTRSNFDD